MVRRNDFYLLCLQFPVVGQNGGLITLPRIADMYESLGRFLKDLGLLNQVCSKYTCTVPVDSEKLYGCTELFCSLFIKMQ